MINGVTHTDGVLNRVPKYRGKISTGLDGDAEGNTTGHMIALGYFRISKEVTESRKIAGGKDSAIKKWVVNEDVQKKLEIANTPQGQPVCKQPRKLKIVSFYKEASEMWESFLAMFNQKDGLVCRGHGIGTKAKRLYYTGSGERDWREIDCPHKECEDFKAKRCRAMGILKCFPSVDVVPSLPYRLETKSINTILAIENGLNDIWYILRAAHRAKELDIGKEIPFDGFFLKEMMLIHRKIKSGGRDVFITEIHPTQGLVEEIMGPINKMIKNRPALEQKFGSSVSLLDQSAVALLTSKTDIIDELDQADQTSIAQEFPIAEDLTTEEVVSVEQLPAVDDARKSLM